MNPGTHVYCTNCAHLIIGVDDIPHCKFENKCNIWDCEDSKPFKERPYYEINLKFKKDIYVYCPECTHFQAGGHCKFEKVCNIGNYSEGKPFRERPFYKERDTI